MKTQYYTATSLDGFIATEDDSLDWLFQLASVTLGSGKPLFPRRMNPPALRLHTVRQMGEGMVELRYEVVKGGVVRGLSHT